MNAEAHIAEWLVRSGTLAGIPGRVDALPAADAPLRMEQAWPYRHGGFLARLRGASGSWWGVADFGDGGPPSEVLSASARGEVSRLSSPGAFAWRLACDPALAAGRALAAGAGARVGGFTVAPGTQPGDETVETLSYKPLCRCVIRYRRGGSAPVLTKLYAQGRDDATARVHEGLHRFGGAHDSIAQAPPPASRIHDWRALLWPELPGSTLLDAPQDRSPETLVALAGTALASLHRSGVAWSRIHRMADELTGLERWVRLAGWARPEMHDPMLRALDRLQRRAVRFRDGRLVASHRDFHDKQMLIDARRISIIDLDTACLAEPELDLGNFLAHLRLRELQGRIDGWQPATRAFLDAYLRTNADVERGRLGFYRICATLRLACVYALRPQWAWLLPQLVGDACRDHEIHC